MRAPNSRNGMRHSWINRMLLVFVRSRAGIHACDAAIATDPTLADAFGSRGVVLRRQRQYKRALADFDTAIRLAPGNPAFHNGRGRAFLEIHDLDSAMAAYDRALALDPRHVSSLFGRAMVLYQRRELDAAIVAFDAALALDPTNAIGFANRAETYFDMGKNFSDRTITTVIDSFPDPINFNHEDREAHLRELARQMQDRAMEVIYAHAIKTCPSCSIPGCYMGTL
mgnify:CR=1 FL=1